jgi:hypothetical protein
VSIERANTLTEVRAETLNESTRTLVLLNGGGAVATATWLQAVWGEAWAAEMLRPQVIGAALLLAGALLAATCPYIRYLSFLHRNTLSPLRNPWWWCQTIATVLSLAAFGVGMSFVVIGAWRALP